MVTHLFSRSAGNHKPLRGLESGSRVAVIGGGPAGSFFSYFLLELAERVGIDLKVDIYEPRDFSLPAPQGCNMCAGVISETLVQNLATEGINLPSSIVQKGISSYVLHTDSGSQRIDAVNQEKRIGAIFRGAGPHGIREMRYEGFDQHLLSLAEKKGANVIRMRVTGVERTGDRMQVRTHSNPAAGYDLLAVAAGVNTTVLKLFEQEAPKYRPPQAAKTAIREYYLGKQAVEKYFGDSLHVFLLDIPGLDFAMIVPKGDFVSVSLLGKQIDDRLLQDFLTAPEVKSCFPEGWRWDQPGCQCLPRINVRAAIQPYADRVVFIGDSGVSRLYKDGIGSAYRAAKAAASCAILEGISSEDFRRHYAPFYKTMEADNRIGRVIFSVTYIIQHFHFFRKAVLRMVAAEQRSPGGSARLSSVLWDTFTGSASYREVFLRTLHPAFTSHFVWGLITSVLGV
ncbi:MAG: NAD(P)/FAD-dependent oxidoreductase [Omnitrophica WOR_2 bacterium]